MKSSHHRHKRALGDDHFSYGHLLGFTLLELMVVVALIAGLMAIAIPSIRSLGGLDLKTEIVKIAGLSNEVYNLAAISGKTHRIVFDLDTQQYWVEEKVGDAGEIKPEIGYNDLLKSRVEKKDEGADKFGISFKEASSFGDEKFSLPKNLVFRGVWTEDMKEVARHGKAALYFFPRGFTQASFISIAIKDEEQENSIYVALNPLTAQATINLGEPETKDLLSEGEP